MSKNSNKSTKAKEPEGTPATPQVEVKRHWRKPNPLNVKGLDKNKSYRWVDKKKLQQKKYEGYETVDPKSVNYTAPDTEGYEGAPQYRELVLCEMPNLWQKSGMNITGRNRKKPWHQQRPSFTRKQEEPV